MISSPPVQPKPGRFAIDAPAVLEAVAGVVVALVALFSSDDHISFFGRVISVQQQWGIWLIALSLPLVLVDAQLAAGSRKGDAAERARAESDRAGDRAQAAEERDRAAEERNRAAEERQRVAGLDRIRNRLDRSRLAFELDPTAEHRRQLQRLLTLLGSPQMEALLARTSPQS